MAPQNRTVERIIARIAGRAHGIVTWAEMRRAGVSEAEIKRRVENGLLIPLHRGVYRVGHAAPSVDATFIAAVKACGEGAALSGRAAGYLLGLIKGRPPPPEVTAPTQRRVKGVVTHRARRAERDVIKVRGIPVTSVAQTLVDSRRSSPKPSWRAPATKPASNTAPPLDTSKPR